MNEVARCYFEAIGVEKNLDSGAEWYLKSARLNDVDGMFNVGKCYLSGTGVAKSRTEAVRWLRKAADHGNRDAMKLLNNLLE